MRENITKEIDEGRIWRAKEIIRSEIGRTSYDKDLYEEYGIVLSLMRDDLEAGKFFFLSGVRESNYTAQISLFLDRHARGGYLGLVSHLPKAAKFSRIEDFPDPIKSEIMSMGFTPPATENKNESDGLGWSWWLVITIVLISIPVGIVTMVSWVWGFIAKIFS